jgi:MFS superfamily sulfate permease-like transporter
VPGTALVIDKITRSCAKVRLLPDRREVKVPVMSLADPQILSNPESGLLASALVACLLAGSATEQISVSGPESALSLMPEKVFQ